MHEWLSGGVSPCQGEGRGFESRLVLFLFAAETFRFKGFRCFCVSYRLYTVVDSLQSLRYEVISFLFRQWIVDITQCSVQVAVSQQFPDTVERYTAGI